MAIEFDEAMVETFMGGKLKMPDRPGTARELAEFLEAAAQEVRSWGEDTRLSEVYFHHDTIDVTLEEGIVQ